MRVGWLGLGKIGLPIALCLAKHGGHEVTGYDVREWPWHVLNGEAVPPQEEALAGLLDPGAIRRAGSVAQPLATPQTIDKGNGSNPHSCG